MPSSKNIIGVDLGGTKIALARFDAKTFKIVEKKRIQTRAKEKFGFVFEQMMNEIELMRNDRTIAIGVGVPGLVDHKTGEILKMPNIPGALNFPLKKEMEKLLKLPVGVDNDTNCFSLAEATFGAGKGYPVVVGLTFGTGVGGGIVIDGKLYRGSRGYAAEIGHMLLRPGAPPFETDDKRGDVEQFLSGSALGKRCNQAKKPEQYLKGETCEFMHDDLFEEVAWLCTNLIHLLDPSVIVLGGSAGRALKPHLGTIKKELKKWMLPKTPLPVLDVSVLKDAATLGAALLTKED